MSCWRWGSPEKMSGWLGTMNYGVITANKMDKWLYEKQKTLATA